jgi:hypothetical protein
LMWCVLMSIDGTGVELFVYAQGCEGRM